MRRLFCTVAVTTALGLPTADAVAAARAAKPTTVTPKKKVVTVTKKFSGSTASVDRWGDIQVVLSVRKTTTTVGKKKTVKRRIMGVQVPLYPNHTDRSVYINQQALPLLVQEVLQAQSANIQMISGATDTSGGFEQSLQAAILRAVKG